ncbi:MAG: T9SS type A sorting domain-containing protein [Saprospiraceae bacterium]|nr:T9SS type A sorting domain-containing protein [Saprospiraceae bacterium]
MTYNNHGAVFVVAGGNATLWSHELGHYFGLPHTFANTPWQYVNSPVLINGQQYTCYQTGDGFCDTPADPETCYNFSNCAVTCNGATDPLGVPYNPDPTLLMSYFGFGCPNRFSGEQKQAMRTLYLYHPNYAAISNAPPECLVPQFGKIERNCLDIIGAGDISPIVSAPVEVRGALNFCNGQNNLTDNQGRYKTEPCVVSGPPLRRVLPDRTYGASLNGVSAFDLVLINKHILGIELFENPFQMIAADANNSGTITTFDIVAIRRVILGIDATYPAGNWRYVPKICTETQAFKDDFYDGNPFDAIYIDPFQGFTRQYKSTIGNIPNIDSWMDHFSLVTTHSASHNEAAWSFTGVKVGDVNCNAIVDEFSSESDDHEFLVQPGSTTSIAVGNVKKIQVVASVANEVIAWQFATRFASDSLTILDVLPGNTGTTFDEENYYYSTPTLAGNNDGILRSIWYATDGNAVNLNGKVLFEVLVEADNSIGHIKEVFKLDSRALDMRFYDESGQAIDSVSLTLRLEEASSERAESDRVKSRSDFKAFVYPVPFNSEIIFEFELPDKETANLSLFDPTGKLLFETNVALPAGYHQINIPEAKGYPSGLYWYSLKAGQQQASGKITKN